MTYVVGIDVSSEKHDCCILGDDGTCDSFTFSNSSKGFQELLEKLPDPENTMIGMEATGIYGNNLNYTLENGQIKFWATLVADS